MEYSSTPVKRPSSLARIRPGRRRPYRGHTGTEVGATQARPLPLKETERNDDYRARR